MQTTQQKKRGRPPSSGLSHSSTKKRLIDCATAILSEKGFSRTGIDEILKQVNVPKGSFYHYFKNKEDFGTAVINNYAKYFAKKLDRFFSDEKLTPLARLNAFIEDAKIGMEKYHYARGCLIGNLGQELSQLDDPFRDQIEAVFLDWEKRLSQLFAHAQRSGELANDIDCADLASYFWIGWEGAVLRAKLVKNKKPLQIFQQQFFSRLH
jgi:TetR/AcrR family transcriptional repressor of nem operon